MRKMPEAVDTVRRLGANGKWEGYRTGQTGNELPSPHVRLRLIDDRVAQAPEGVKRQLVIPGGPLWVTCGRRPGKNFLTFCSIGRVRSRVRPVFAAGYGRWP